MVSHVMISIILYRIFLKQGCHTNQSETKRAQRTLCDNNFGVEELALGSWHGELDGLEGMWNQ